MPEYIECEALIKDIEDNVIFTVRGGAKLPTAEMRGANKVIDRIKNQPTADVAEVKHGKWLMRGGWFRCSECDEKAELRDVGGTGGFSHEYEQIKSNYCPNCGAKMDKE